MLEFLFFFLKELLLTLRYNFDCLVCTNLKAGYGIGVTWGPSWQMELYRQSQKNVWSSVYRDCMKDQEEFTFLDASLSSLLKAAVKDLRCLYALNISSLHFIC